MTSDEIKEVLYWAELEYNKACEKHPPIKRFSGYDEKAPTISLPQLHELIKHLRKINDSPDDDNRRFIPHKCWQTILEEEIIEAIEAYTLENYADCIDELIQCAAVILRMIEFVKTKIKNEVENETQKVCENI